VHLVNCGGRQQRLGAGDDREGDRRHQDRDRRNQHSDQCGRNPFHRLGRQLVPGEDHDNGGQTERRRQVVAAAIGRPQALVDRLWNRQQVDDARSLRLIVDHDMELGREDQHSDAGQHAVDHRRSHGAEELAGMEQRRG
jgi:hypothetical protein